MEPGTGRRQIDETLRVAYGEGLLSEPTFVDRVEQLFTATTVDPTRLIGDLTIRAFHRRRARSWWTAISRPRQRRESWVPLLALDWTGTVERLLVGRGAGVDIRLDDGTVSRAHAELVWRGGFWAVRDLGSKNGTVLNGEPVGRAQLRPGDLIEFADARFRVD